MTRRSGGTLGACILYIAALSGVGYSSGQEVARFFARYGTTGFVTLLTVPVLLFGMSFLFVRTAQKKAASGDERVFVSGGRGIVSRFSDGILTLVMVLGVVLPITAAGSLLRRLCSAPVWLGNVLLTLLIGAALLVHNMQLVVRIMTPLMYVFIGCIFVICLTVLLTGHAGEPAEYAGDGKWLLAGASLFQYISFNLLCLFGVLFAVGKDVSTAKGAVVCCGAGAAVIGATLLLQYLTIRRLGAPATAIDMPMLYAAAKISPVFQTAFGLCMLFGCFGTSVSCFNSLISRVLRGREITLKGYYATAACLLAAAFLLSLWGFSNVISYAYPLIGTLGLPLHIWLVLPLFRRRTERQRQSPCCPPADKKKDPTRSEV